jgi:hypothetical protein
MTKNFQFDHSQIEFIKKSFTNNFKFRFSLFKILPMGFLSGMKISKLTEEKCSVTVPYKRKNKNPFRSTFWAVLGMAAEMSSGALLIMYTHKQKPSVAMIIVNCKGNFVKKATDITTFTCNDGQKIKQAIKTAIEKEEPQLIECDMAGVNEAGEEVANFTFTWSVKARVKK